MQKLYIIGNGFDIAHGLPTKYWDFRKYLEANHPDFLQLFERMYGFEPFDDSDPYLSGSQKVCLEHINKTLWSALESEMGHLDAGPMEDFALSILNDMGLEPENTGIRDTMDEYWEHEYGFIVLLQTYIKEWISSVDLSRVVPRKHDLIENNRDLFLSFNYTETLEEVYGTKNVLHIHGGIGDTAATLPIMGHGNGNEIVERRRLANQAENKFDESSASIQSAIRLYLERTFKDTKSIISRNSAFFDELSKVDHIIILGWSIGESDVLYLQKIVHSALSLKKWTTYYYKPEDLASIKDTLTKNIPQKILSNLEVEFLPSDTYWDN